MNNLQIIKRLSGSWRLPISNGESATITFQPSGLFAWNISARNTATKAKQLVLGDDMIGNWHISSEKSTSSVSSFSSFSSSFASKPKADKPLEGPFLILNFKKLPESILNINAFGFRLEIANFINNFLELVRDGNYRIVEFETESMTLENPKGEIEVWHKAQE